MTTKAQRTAAGTAPQDGAISDVKRGVSTGLGLVKSEDERRAEGTDASQAEGAGEHDDSPEARSGQVPSAGVIDAYTGMPGSTHDNRSEPGQPLVLGQAPSAPCVPMKGSRNYGEEFHPEVPNGINRSPMVVGVDPETGKRPQVKSHADLKDKLVEDEDDHETGQSRKADLIATT